MSRVGLLASLPVIAVILALSVPSLAAAAPGDQALWLEECGACHDAFPPALLPGYSWKKLMDGLKDHFGTDAALDEARRLRILDFLLSGRPETVPTRITEQDWFIGIHGGSLTRYAEQQGFRIMQCGKCHRFGG